MRWLTSVLDRPFRFLPRLIFTPILLGWMIGAMLFGAMLGFIIGGVVALSAFGPPLGQSVWEWVIITPPVLIGAIFGFQYWRFTSGADNFFGLNGDSHGSARFASRKELKTLVKPDGLLIGRSPAGQLLRYDGPAHLLTLAPTRAGKGVGTVIPNLLVVDRSVIVVDPKGENARIAGAARHAFGQVHVLDPFEVSGQPSSSYNPLDRLTAASSDLGEDATTLADALVMDPPGQVQEAHWNEEAKAILSGLIMFCVAHEERDKRNLATVREYLTLPPDRFRALLELMQDSDAAHGLIARAAIRFLGKADREAASVLSNAQRHTHFLDSPRITNVISSSDFHFAELQQRTVSVFLVLPPNRLDAYSRWLRLLISQALQDIARHAEQVVAPVAAPQAPTEARNAAQGASGAAEGPEGGNRASRPPNSPTLFLLDEFAALGRLEAIERAMGLMAGYGLQLWPILQDMSQLNDLYGKCAGTFVANAGVQQVFGVNDLETAQWLSKMIGQETTGYQTQSYKPGDAPSMTQNVTGRDLLTPDEIMQMPPDLQLLRVQGNPTALARKLRYYADPEFKGLFQPQNQ